MNGEHTKADAPLAEEKWVLLPMYQRRLLNVVKALREDPDPENFTMHTFRNRCGTPACALGHYAARKDLQDVFYLRKSGCIGLRRQRNRDLGVDALETQSHFGLDYDRMDELFGPDGCDRATTPLEAAAYIEKFVERHS